MGICEIAISCPLNCTVIVPDEQHGFVDLIQDQHEPDENTVRISREQWQILKRSVDHCFDQMTGEIIDD